MRAPVDDDVASELRCLVERMGAIAPLAADVGSRIDALPVEAHGIACELGSLHAILDIARRRLAGRAVELIEGR